MALGVVTASALAVNQGLILWCFYDLMNVTALGPSLVVLQVPSSSQFMHTYTVAATRDGAFKTVRWFLVARSSTPLAQLGQLQM